MQISGQSAITVRTLSVYAVFAACVVVLLASCNKKPNHFCGIWETPAYNAYVIIERQGDVFMVSIKDKSGNKTWTDNSAYAMYFDSGVLKSNSSAFKLIRFDSAHQAIRINDGDDEWHKTTGQANT